jgi:lambda family phage portal protein
MRIAPPRWFNRNKKDGPAVRYYTRGWKGAAIDRLTADWQTSSLSADGELRDKLKILRARARDLWMNDDYAKKYINMLSTNIIGPKGITLQNKAGEWLNGKWVFDTVANRKIEDAFWDWGEKFCDVTGTLNWLALQRLVVETVGRDGEIFIRKVPGFKNSYAFALQLLEADYCPDEYNVAELPGGNRVVMGVELDKWGRRVAYYFTAKHPGDGRYMFVNEKYIRIPANEVIHVYEKTRSSQTRGVPWMATAMTRLKMLNAYEQAEVVAARAGAGKMGFFTQEDGADGQKYTGDRVKDNGEIISEFEPGVFEQLPPGFKFQGWDPQHPNANYGQFHKDILRSISAGLGVSYNSLANDLESTSYSSGRIGILEERDNWRKLQQWIIADFHQKVFEPWLETAFLTPKLNLPAVKFDKFNSATWHARGWDWVDPEKDANANIESINFGLKTRTEVLAENGKDFTEHLEQLKEEKKAITDAGLEFKAPGEKKEVETKTGGQEK